MTKEQYHTRKAAGVCPECGKHPPQYGYVLCVACQDAWTQPATRAHMRLVRAALGGTRVVTHYTPRQTRTGPVSPPPSAVEDAATIGANYVGHCVSCGKPTPVPGVAHCDLCRAHRAAGYALQMASTPALQHEAPGPNRVGHCGQWWDASTLPVTCGRCGWVWGQ